MTDLDLLPCPFCASTEVHSDNSDIGASNWIVCDNCGAQSGPGNYEDVIADWNRRAPAAVTIPAAALAAKDARIAELEAQLAECGEWEPVSEGTIEFAAGGDSMGIARPKALVLGGSNKGTLIMSTLSMAGESRFGYTVRWGKDWRIQRRMQREDENE